MHYVLRQQCCHPAPFVAFTPPELVVHVQQVAPAPKVSKPVKRRAWSWADEADLSPEEQARLLDEYLRANPDPFAKK